MREEEEGERDFQAVGAIGWEGERESRNSRSLERRSGKEREVIKWVRT